MSRRSAVGHRMPTPRCRPSEIDRTWQPHPGTLCLRDWLRPEETGTVGVRGGMHPTLSQIIGSVPVLFRRTTRNHAQSGVVGRKTPAALTWAFPLVRAGGAGECPSARFETRAHGSGGRDAEVVGHWIVEANTTPRPRRFANVSSRHKVRAVGPTPMDGDDTDRLRESCSDGVGRRRLWCSSMCPRQFSCCVARSRPSVDRLLPGPAAGQVPGVRGPGCSWCVLSVATARGCLRSLHGCGRELRSPRGLCSVR